MENCVRNYRQQTLKAVKCIRLYSEKIKILQLEKGLPIHHPSEEGNPHSLISHQLLHHGSLGNTGFDDVCTSACSEIKQCSGGAYAVAGFIELDVQHVHLQHLV